nr:unnamed protein product [Callosobruchus chinensis]
MFGIPSSSKFTGIYGVVFKTDVLLLADVLKILESLQFRMLKYYTAPGLAYASALKMSRVTLELLDDVDKIMFIEKGIRGGISRLVTDMVKLIMFIWKMNSTLTYLHHT